MGHRHTRVSFFQPSALTGVGITVLNSPTAGQASSFPRTPKLGGKVCSSGAQPGAGEVQGS